MADNTQLNTNSTAGDIISTDVITTLNGAGIATGEKAQRVKVGSGVDGTFNDATSTTPIPVRIGDGTNQITVKAASTAAVAGDTAEVVALHPTSPLPTGSNVIGALSANQSVNAAQVGGTAVTGFPAGFVRVTDEPTQIFYDPFDSFDTTNRWNAATTAGGGVAAAVSSGVLTLGSGTTINGYSYLTSQASFTPTVPAWLGNSWAIQIESGATAGNNAVRFWGCGSIGGTPTSTNPLGATGNGYGFELDISGVLQAVVYAGGVRTVVSSLAALQPTDGAYHRYICYFRTDKIYWYIDGLGSTQLAATSNFQSPSVQTLPLLALCVAHSSAPAASRVITCTGLAVWDTGKNNSAISDGSYGWRKATVKAGSALPATTDTALVVSQRDAIPAGTNVIGSVNLVSSAGNQAAVSQALSAAVADNPGVATTVSTTAQAIAAVANSGNATFHLLATAFVGTVVFEGSVNGGVNYAPVMCIREDGTGAETSTAISTASAFIRAYTVGLPGFTHFRVRCSAFTSGSLSVYLVQGPFMVETNPTLATGNATIGSVKTTDGTNTATVKAASTASIAADTALVVAMHPTTPVPAGTNKIGTVDIATAVATAKGTQGANAVPTQDLKDAGRNPIHFYTLIPVLTSATDTLQSLTGTKGGATVVATTTPAVVTTGKTLRITRLAATYIATATSGYGIARLRFNTGGVVAVTSPIAGTLAVGAGTPATANSVGFAEAALNEGWEFAAGTGIGISVQGFAAVTATAVGYVLVSVTGYEY